MTHGASEMSWLWAQWNIIDLLNHLFRCSSKKTSKLHVTGLCAGTFHLMTSSWVFCVCPAVAFFSLESCAAFGWKVCLGYNHNVRSHLNPDMASTCLMILVNFQGHLFRRICGWTNVICPLIIVLFHNHFYPRPNLAFGYCRCLRMSVCASVCAVITRSS